MEYGLRVHDDISGWIVRKVIMPLDLKYRTKDSGRHTDFIFEQKDDRDSVVVAARAAFNSALTTFER